MHHPDEGGDPKLFRHVAEANEVLSDPTKRKLYDIFGHSSFKVYQRFDNNDFKFNWIFRRVRVYLACLPALVMIQVLIIPTALENSVEWDAESALYPIFIVDAIILMIVLIVFFILRKENKKADPIQKFTNNIAITRLFVYSVLSTAFHSLIVEKVDENGHSWVAVFSPMIAMFSILTYINLVETIFVINDTNALIAENGGQPISLSKSLYIIISATSTSGILLAFFVVIAYKAEGEYERSWYSVFIPLWILFARFFIAGILNSVRLNESGILFAAFTGLLTLSPFLVFLGLIAAKLEGGDFSWHEVFAPLYAVLALVCCVGSSVFRYKSWL